MGQKKRLHIVSMISGISTLAVGLLFSPVVSADGPEDFGCYDQSIGCDNPKTGGSGGSCRYNVSRNACTCTGELPLSGGTWEENSGECQMPIVST